MTDIVKIENNTVHVEITKFFNFTKDAWDSNSVRIGNVEYDPFGKHNYPEDGMVIPQLGDAVLKTVFVNSRNPTILHSDQIGFTPGVASCEVVALQKFDGTLYFIHNPGGLFTQRSALFNVIWEELKGSKVKEQRYASYLQQHLGNLTTYDKSKPDRLPPATFAPVRKPEFTLFPEVYILGYAPQYLSNLLTRFVSNVRQIQLPLNENEFNCWLAPKGKNLEWAVQYKDDPSQYYSRKLMKPVTELSEG